MAIEHALKAIQEEKYQNAIIISDSKTAISAINNIYSTNNTILNILELHEKLTHNGTKTEILWIPSHIGIGGNEKADLEDLSKSIKRKLATNWENEWNNIASQYIKNLIDNSQTSTESIKLSRIEQVAINRIKIGHTKITHAHLLTREPAPTCYECKETITTDHLILHCPKYKDARTRLKSAPQLRTTSRKEK